MIDTIKILHDGNYSCVVEKNNEVFTFSKRGIADLYDMVKNKPYFLKGAVIADKVVGKGAAALMILGGTDKLYADIISIPALTLLRDAGIEVDFGHSVPFIWNRNRTDWCPMEKMCYNEITAEAIYPLIEKFMNKMTEPREIESVEL